MGFNASGTFTIETVGNPVVADTDISPDTHNATLDEIADGLSKCITKDGQTTVSANIPMNSKKFVNLAAGSQATDSANISNIKTNTGVYVGTVGGTVDAITLTPLPAATYTVGEEFLFLATGANTGATTVNVSGLGVKSITKKGATALGAGDIANAEMVRIIYDGTRFQKQG